MLVDRLYAVEPGAQFFPIWGRFRVTSGGSAAVSLTPAWLNEQQQPFMLSRVGAELTPGAAQTAIKWGVAIFDPENAIFAVLGGGELTNAVAAQSQFVGLSGEGILVPPKYRVRITGIFSAGANANQVDIYGIGYFIPRGTIATP